MLAGFGLVASCLLHVLGLWSKTLCHEIHFNGAAKVARRPRLVFPLILWPCHSDKGNRLVHFARSCLLSHI
jgi:hypothetical protein